MSEPEIIDVQEIPDVPIEVEEPLGEPSTPKSKPKQVRKKAAPRALPQDQSQAPQQAPPQAPALVVDADFWGELLATRRELDRVAKNQRYANLVKF